MKRRTGVPGSTLQHAAGLAQLLANCSRAAQPLRAVCGRESRPTVAPTEPADASPHAGSEPSRVPVTDFSLRDADSPVASAWPRHQCRPLRPAAPPFAPRVGSNPDPPHPCAPQSPNEEGSQDHPRSARGGAAVDCVVVDSVGGSFARACSTVVHSFSTHVALRTCSVHPSARRRAAEIRGCPSRMGAR